MKTKTRLSMKFLREILRQLGEGDWASSDIRHSVALFLDIVEKEIKKPLKP